jgi:hypothetical protein
VRLRSRLRFACTSGNGRAAAERREVKEDTRQSGSPSRRTPLARRFAARAPPCLRTDRRLAQGHRRAHHRAQQAHTGATPSGCSQGAGSGARPGATRQGLERSSPHACCDRHHRGCNAGSRTYFGDEQRTAVDGPGGRTLGAVAQRDEAVAIQGLHARGPSARGAERQRAGSLQSRGRSCKTLPSLSAWPQAQEGRRM